MTQSVDLLTECQSRFREAETRAVALFKTVSPEATLRRPTPDRWSVGECMQHLIVTSELYFPRMRTAITRACAAGGSTEPPYRRGSLVGKILINSVQNPNRRFKAPGLFRPQDPGLEPSEILSRYGASHRTWDGFFDAARGLDLGHRFPTPISRWVRISLEQAFLLHSHHEIRHVAQAERVLKEPGFSSS